ncbi:MAG: glycerol-3-phosphate 1-O-acyltransferase PlsY [Thermaerobacter sp.]|nr:glycerol-3-phosphate 1-O-acyltransferase PlsY [Thermaerobacter sp.]
MTQWGLVGGWLILWFLVGAVPFGYVLGKVIYGTDLRQYGSRNIGATNAARTFGMKFGLAVLVMDGLKGWAGVVLAMQWFPHDAVIIGLTGTAAMWGHVFSPFLRFRGGKGVATGLGAALMLDWKTALLAVAGFAVVVVPLRIVSLASLAGMLALIVSLWARHHMTYLWVFGLPTVAVSLWAHRANWVRLLRGQEPRFGRRTQ